jgi:hypothetical protein
MKEEKIVKMIGDNNIKRLANIIMPRYYALIKSEEIAKNILEENGYEFFDLLSKRKKRYEEFLEYIEVEGLDDCLDNIDYKVSRRDVINRLDEQFAHHITEMEKAYENGDEQYAYTEIGTVIYDKIKEFDKIKEDYILEQKAKKYMR